MNKNIIYISIILVIFLLWLLNIESSISLLRPSNTAYMQNTDNGFAEIRTSFGSFPVSIVGAKSVDNGTELSLALINPTNIHFAEVLVSVRVEESVETIRANLVPGINNVKMKIKPIQRGDSFEISLGIDKVFFK